MSFSWESKETNFKTEITFVFLRLYSKKEEASFLSQNPQTPIFDFVEDSKLSVIHFGYIVSFIKLEKSAFSCVFPKNGSKYHFKNRVMFS